MTSLEHESPLLLCFFVCLFPLWRSLSFLISTFPLSLLSHLSKLVSFNKKKKNTLFHEAWVITYWAEHLPYIQLTKVTGCPYSGCPGGPVSSPTMIPKCRARNKHMAPRGEGPKKNKSKIYLTSHIHKKVSYFLNQNCKTLGQRTLVHMSG